jgi:cytochrome c-type biogenesis protein CcmH
MKVLYAVALLISLLAPSVSWAVQPNEMLTNPVLEARARALSKNLRCMVCQNESIDDSEAPLAHDLRVLVRERIKAGDSDQRVLDFLVARYGEFVLLKPPLSWHTVALWGLPPAALLIGGLVIIADLRRRRVGQPAEEANLSAAEEARLAELLRDSSAP